MTARLEGLRQTGPGRWSARCPSHADRSPSLSVREADDGRLLLRCFAGCETAAVVGALGLRLADLFPPREGRQPGDGAPRERRPWSASDLLRVAAFESSICALVAADIAAGRPVSDIDKARLLEAVARLGLVAEAAA